MASTLSQSGATLQRVRLPREAAQRTDPDAAPVVAWLLACCALVFAMVVIGGVTRLTHSGLSITEWQPIVGTIPPLGAADWADAFAKYQATPEFRDVNHAMTLAEFKGIFWWEYVHRMLGRLIGMAFLVPFLWFAATRRIPRGYGLPLAGVFLLGGLQGAVGWYMVKSGLVDDPRVSQFRLTLHLGLAFLILGAMLWPALSLRSSRPVAEPSARLLGTRRLALGYAALVFLMVLTGGMVAGLRAGFAYNTFPLMNGHWVPPEVLSLEPAWRNAFWNMATVQFDHRVLALLVALGGILLAWRVRRTPDAPLAARRAAPVLLGMLGLQIGLGVATLLLIVPVPLAAAHQAGAVLLFGCALYLARALR